MPTLPRRLAFPVLLAALLPAAPAAAAGPDPGHTAWILTSTALARTYEPSAHDVSSA